MRLLAFAWKKLFLPIILVILIVAFAWIASAQPGRTSDNNASSPVQPTKRYCVPTPSRPTPVDLHGATPLPPTPVSTHNANAPTLQPLPTYSPYVISKTTDLSPDGPERDKAFVYVLHCDGSIEIFKVIPKGDIKNDVPLLPDDYVLDWVPPASMMGHEPPPPPYKTPTPTPTIPGYPPPVPPMSTSTQSTYP
jgi:hypothetical protein